MVFKAWNLNLEICEHCENKAWDKLDTLQILISFLSNKPKKYALKCAIVSNYWPHRTNFIEKGIYGQYQLHNKLNPT